jgi:hypothetical protein
MSTLNEVVDISDCMWHLMAFFSEVHSKQSFEVELSSNFKVLMKVLCISYRRKRAATVIWRRYIAFHIVLNIMRCSYFCFTIYWSPANTLVYCVAVLLILKTHLLRVSALILVNFQQKQEQDTHLCLLSTTCFLPHKLNVQRAILFSNHGGINIEPDVQEITPKKYFSFQLERNI